MVLLESDIERLKREIADTQVKARNWSNIQTSLLLLPWSVQAPPQVCSCSPSQCRLLVLDTAAVRVIIRGSYRGRAGVNKRSGIAVGPTLGLERSGIAVELKLGLERSGIPVGPKLGLGSVVLLSSYNRKG